MELVIVKFLDPTTFAQWELADQVDKLPARECIAAGWLVEESEKFVKVALLTTEEADSFSNWITIPVGCVVSITKDSNLNEDTGRLSVQSNPH